MYFYYLKPVLMHYAFVLFPQWIVMIGLEGGTRNSGTTSTSTARQHAVQAMDYYSSNVLRARANAGMSSARQQRSIHDPLYRSNSSLELTHHSDYHHHHQHQQQQHHQQQHHHHHGGVGHFGGSTAYIDSKGAATDRPLVSPLLKREYGSHGSIDVIASDRNSAGRASAGENFFAMLQDYRPTVLDMIDGNSEYHDYIIVFIFSLFNKTRIVYRNLFSWYETLNKICKNNRSSDLSNYNTCIDFENWLSLPSVYFTCMVKLKILKINCVTTI